MYSYTLISDNHTYSVMVVSSALASLLPASRLSMAGYIVISRVRVAVIFIAVEEKRESLRLFMSLPIVLKTSLFPFISPKSLAH